MMNRYKTLKFNTARNALTYIIRAFQIEELYLPYYMCPSVRTQVIRTGCRIKFYHIDINFNPVIEFPEEAYILYPNYFGICGSIADKLADKYKNLIVDNAHSFYSSPKGIASFNSVRKFFPVLRDGAFLYTTKTVDINIEQDNYYYKPESLSFRDFCINENRLDGEKIKYMSDCTNKYFLKLNMKKEKQKFIESFCSYHTKLSEINRLKISLNKNDIPFKYPYLAENKAAADEFVKKCEKDGITIFRCWNNLPQSFKEKEFYNCLIAL